MLVMDIKGVIIAIGGNENKGLGDKPRHIHDKEESFDSGVLSRIISEMNDPESAIEVITTASSIRDQVGENYIQAFRKLGHSRVSVLHPTNREEANDPTVLERISKAGCILFSGGDQFKLTTAFRETSFSKVISERYQTDQIVIAGTSAGAMAMPDLMIYPGDKAVDEFNKEVHLYQGLSLIHDAIIDTHFLVRGRFRRLAIAVAIHPTHIGLGLEEDTGIIIREGNKVETIGTGLVTILDGRNLQNSNFTVRKGNHEILIENLLVHILCGGNHFTLSRRKIQ